jgi:hypothetical protein
MWTHKLSYSQILFGNQTRRKDGDFGVTGHNNTKPKFMGGLGFRDAELLCLAFDKASVAYSHESGIIERADSKIS